MYFLNVRLRIGLGWSWEVVGVPSTCKLCGCTNTDWAIPAQVCFRHIIVKTFREVNNDDDDDDDNNNNNNTCNRVLLEKLNGSQLVKKFPAFYGTRRSITAFTTARHLSLSWARSIRSMSLNPTSWISILILSSHLRQGLPSGLFPSGFHTKTLHTTLLSPHTRYVPSPSH